MIAHSCACVFSMTAPGQGCEPLGGAMGSGEKAYDIPPMISKKKRKNPLFLMRCFCSVSTENATLSTYGHMHEYVLYQPSLQGENVNCSAPKREGEADIVNFPFVAESQLSLGVISRARRQSPGLPWRVRFQPVRCKQKCVHCPDRLLK